MLDDIAAAIDQCSTAERAKLARFLTMQAEANMADRPGASRVFAWLGVVAAGETPSPIRLDEIPQGDRRYVRDISATLARMIDDEAALKRAVTPADLASEGGETEPVGRVWRLLQEAMQASLAQGDY